MRRNMVTSDALFMYFTIRSSPRSSDTILSSSDHTMKLGAQQVSKQAGKQASMDGSSE